MEVVDTMKNGAISHGVAAAFFMIATTLLVILLKSPLSMFLEKQMFLAHELARAARSSPPSV
jgi:hypothetical protein